ncbi:MAG: translesion error-prone DNA polymerase V autoproteolytic subunit [Legionellaceae bacterium]|nr:translesion error-prone DNA polymerase V autoproteolytic subunit [Legionellaceae bacterium]
MHGGKRVGAGRPSGKNKYGEATKPIRIPISKLNAITSFLEEDHTMYELPLYANKISAGFPSPADDYLETKLDLNSYLIKHPSSTFFVKVSGDSMINAGIQSGDMLIVDRSIEPTDGKIVIAALDGELTVKRLYKKNGQLKLVAENIQYKPIDVVEQEIVIWGVVTHVIHEAK